MIANVVRMVLQPASNSACCAGTYWQLRKYPSCPLKNNQTVLETSVPDGFFTVNVVVNPGSPAVCSAVTAEVGAACLLREVRQSCLNLSLKLGCVFGCDLNVQVVLAQD